MLNAVRVAEPLRWCLKLLAISPSVYYYQLKHPTQEITELKKYQRLKPIIERIIRRHSAYGYRRLQIELRKQNIVINDKPLKKLLKIWHLSCFRRIRKPKLSRLAKDIKELGARANLAAKVKNPRPFQIILTDFTRIVTAAKIFWLILFADQVTKKIIGWNVSPRDDTENALKAFKRACRCLKRLKVDFAQVIVHQDRDSVFTGYEYVGAVVGQNMKPSFTQRGFKDNPYMETCNGHFKQEYLHLIQEAQEPPELKRIIARCVRDWNQRRIHSTLKGRSPDEFIHTVLKL